jgi:hypothetical protein
MHGAKLIRALEMAMQIPSLPYNSRVLDYGCGEGHLVAILRKFGYQSNGYDIIPSNKWGEFNSQFFTSDTSNIPDNNKLVILWDVIDHMDLNNFLNAMDAIKGYLSDDGYVWVRAHPFTSRSGGHLDNNKAFMHIILSESEKKQYKIPIQTGLNVIKPLDFYTEAFKMLGYKIINKKIYNSNIEDFFGPNLIERIKIQHFNDKDSVNDIKSIMTIDFIDFMLRPI